MRTLRHILAASLLICTVAAAKLTPDPRLTQLRPVVESTSTTLRGKSDAARERFKKVPRIVAPKPAVTLPPPPPPGQRPSKVPGSAS